MQKPMRQRLERRGFLAGAAVLGAAGPALAATLPVPVSNAIKFKILRNGTPIGEHHMTFAQSGKGLRVESDTDMLVRLAGIPIFHYQGKAVENWENGRFIRVDSQVNHDGTYLRVQADQILGGYAIQSTKAGDYQYTGSPPMLPLTYWNRAVLKAMILNLETGRHYPAIVSSPGWNNLQAANGGSILARRYDVTGKLHLSVWYDQFNQWSGLEFHVDGDIVFQKYIS